jgi:preprotein translocase subunit SecB
MTEELQQGKERQIFEIQKIYQRDVSFEAPNSPQIFTQDWKPDTNVQITTAARELEAGTHEVVLSITVTTKSADKTAYLVETQQAGIFTVKRFEKKQLGHLLGSYCPNLLFPFARESIAELVTKGGFPHFLLAPVNFDALYAEHQQRVKLQGQSSDKAH